MDNRPVGMFDSGVGGLSVLKAFRELAPNERVIYFADTAWFPYGPRPAPEVRKRSFAITHRLLESGVKLIVVACSTASMSWSTSRIPVATSPSPWMRRTSSSWYEPFPVPFVGMVPGVKPAALRSQSGRVVILATEGTLDGELYGRVVEEFARGTRISAVPGIGLAELVEGGKPGTPEARSAVREALRAEVAAGADTVVLGCTHYHFLAGDIRAEFPRLTIVDTSEAVARRAVQVLDEAALRADPAAPGALDLVVSGDREAFREAMARLGFEASAKEAVA